MKRLPYPTILFDWGDTVMKDDPDSSVPMVEWETIEIVEGIQPVLAYLDSSGRRIALATSASISDESQIRGALARAGLDRYFTRIFCYKNTGLHKGQEFYRHILTSLSIPAAEALMVGDGFEKDVLDANKVGMHAVWFNHRSAEKKRDGAYFTVHTMKELLVYFESLDS